MASVVDTPHSAPPNLTNLISSYSILTTLSSWISTLDLYHLALTNRSHHSFILASPQIFKVLTRQSLCDGRGLAGRQEFRGLYKIPDFDKGSGFIRRDEPVEVRLYNLKCDEAGALPCVKCGINVCEECRYYPRISPAGKGKDPKRRPHLTKRFRIGAVMCLCPPCDAAMEEEVKGKFLNELCDCDGLRYWICSRCRKEVDDFTADYQAEHTVVGRDELFWPPPTKEIDDAGSLREMWCMCGASVPRRTPVRCTWCKRCHLPEPEWFKEYKRIGSRMPWFDDDPDYPHWADDGHGNYPVPYPRLGYKRPGDRY